ncbi:TonB-dependent copper receptor, partial [Klebsiella pneumoniae]|nr:TonB-dependent copper receptor [Klebsiella pneumoniae]
DNDTLLEVTMGRGNGEARYAGRSMDGSQFKRESFGLRFEKRNLGGLLDKLEAQLYYNYADHVMDNYTLRTPDPHGMMPMAMASDVDRATWGGRIAGTWNLAPDLGLVTGLDFQQSRHRSRSGTDTVSYRSQNWVKDAS